MTNKRRYVPDLIADMAECDANFIRLHRLFPMMSEEDSLEFGVDARGKRTPSLDIARSAVRDSITRETLSRETLSRETMTEGATIQSTTEDGAIVTLKILERCPYTTMMTVKVTNEEDKPWVRWPTLEVRVYHDIKSAEVVSFERHRNFKFRYNTPNQRMYQPDEKSQINRYFGELLTFCYEHGHSLETVDLGQS
ncbi:MAG: hypothetical protein ACI82A_004017 [Candidatus Azotimanducaceae bacterium]|jgi:uncharacterized protein YqiB (DUF1249 family)